MFLIAEQIRMTFTSTWLTLAQELWAIRDILDVIAPTNSSKAEEPLNTKAHNDLLLFAAPLRSIGDLQLRCKSGVSPPSIGVLTFHPSCPSANSWQRLLETVSRKLASFKYGAFASEWALSQEHAFLTTGGTCIPWQSAGTGRNIFDIGLFGSHVSAGWSWLFA